MSDPRLSIEGRREGVEEVLVEGRPAVEAEISAARRDVEDALAAAESRLAEVTSVSPEALAARAAVISPVLSGAMERPEALLNAYRRRFGDLTDRRLLEESAQVVIDGLAGSDGGQFAQGWNALQGELSMQRPPEERQALDDRAELSELSSYLDSAERLVRLDLAALEPGGLSDGQMVARPLPEAEVNRYESAHGLESSQPRPAG